MASTPLRSSACCRPPDRGRSADGVIWVVRIAPPHASGDRHPGAIRSSPDWPQGGIAAATEAASPLNAGTFGLSAQDFRPRIGFGTSSALVKGGDGAVVRIAPVRSRAGQRVAPVARPWWQGSCKRSPLMNPSREAMQAARRGWALTQADVLFCAMPVVLFLSIVSLL